MYKLVNKSLKDRQLRKYYKSNEYLFYSLAFLEENNLPTQKMRNLKNNLSRARNRCLISGKSTGIYSLFKISSYSFRNKVSSGLILGIRKAI